MRKRIKGIIKGGLRVFDIDPMDLYERIGHWSITKASKQQGLYDLGITLRQIVPEISEQYSRENPHKNAYWELKIRSAHAFQCALMHKGIENLSDNGLIVVDIGDSAGTHMLYLKELTRDRFNIETVSVNLDPRAIEKIKARGLKAVLKRAEDIKAEDIGGKVDLFTSFEMVEHLHNPAIFFRRLAKKTACNKMIVTVPYVEQSRVGLHHIRNQSKEVIYAEDEHVFELSPEDWTLLFLHSGWRVAYSDTYYQYPKKWAIITPLLRSFWRMFDFEGFWGAILEKNTTYCDLYQDWEE
ncbi:MAG: SAM-dependent methyltransferase [Candidatus Thorarchaeota archaeon]|jgi:2-polyprenyl-3-methyl-5-hydroxy-6-metoxy-1,4-benzoquinol methylase